MGDNVVGIGGGGGSGGFVAIAIIIAVIGSFFIWRWMKAHPQSLQPLQPGQNINVNVPGSTAAPVIPGQGQQPTCPTGYAYNATLDTCVLSTAAPVVPGTTPTIPAEEPLPEPDEATCSSQFDGSCNVECGAQGNQDLCDECNAVCSEDVPYTGPPTVPIPSGAIGGAAVPTCPTGYTYVAAQDTCVLTTAAPVYPTTPIPPVLSGANERTCSDVYNGSCNSECSSGTTNECNACMVACGEATAGQVATGQRTAECSSRYNGSCNTECSSGNTSTCNSCRRACGLSTASIAHVYTARQARMLLNNRLYNALNSRTYNPRIPYGYNLNRRFKIGNLL